MGIESPTPPTNVAVTGVGEPVARGSRPSTVTDAPFTVVSRWIDISGLTSIDSGLDFSALKRACYLFVHVIERRLGPAACAARFADIAARASRVAARDTFSPPASSRPTSQRGCTCRHRVFSARVLSRPAAHAGHFHIRLRHRRLARSFLGVRHFAVTRFTTPSGENWREYGRSTR